jgi:excisionase family DNA binding protein
LENNVKHPAGSRPYQHLGNANSLSGKLDTRSCVAADTLEPHRRDLRLDDWIREMVRSEVKAEVTRLLSAAPTRPTHVSVAEYAATRSISASTVRNAIRSGRLPALRIGTAIRVPADAEIGRPVNENAQGRDISPTMRAEQILARGPVAPLVKSRLKGVA